MGQGQSFKRRRSNPPPPKPKPAPAPTPKEDPVIKAAQELRNEIKASQENNQRNEIRVDAVKQKEADKPLIYEKKPLPQSYIPPVAEEDIIIDKPTTDTSGKQIFEKFDNIFGLYNSKMPVFEGLASMEDEKKLLTDLNDFNNKYAKYISCNDSKNCNVSDVELVAEIKAAADVLTADIIELKGHISSEPVVTPTNYNSNYSALDTGYKSVLKLRGELDTQLKELYQTEDSNLNNYKKNFDSTIYSEILLLTLATSLIYYIFTRV